MERSIEDLLNDTPAEEVEETTTQEEVTPEATPEPEATAEGPVRDEQGRFAPKQTGEQQPETVEEATPANPIPDDQFKGYLTEKRKRQELEQQIAAMQAEYARVQAQPRSEAQEPTPDFWDNPQAAFASEAQKAARLALQEYQQMQTMERINASETAAKGKYADYGDAFSAFQQAASANPSLVQQMTSASDPAEFAYKTGKRALELEQVGSIDELIANERAKWEAEARAAIPAPTQTFPATTATDGSVAARTGPAWAGPAPIGELLTR
jgi:hypothetical protein